METSKTDTSNYCRKAKTQVTRCVPGLFTLCAVRDLNPEPAELRVGSLVTLAYQYLFLLSFSVEFPFAASLVEVVVVAGSVFKRCGCRDATGRLCGSRCVLLSLEGHRSWYFGVELAAGSGVVDPVVGGAFVARGIREFVATSSLRCYKARHAALRSVRQNAENSRRPGLDGRDPAPDRSFGFGEISPRVRSSGVNESVAPDQFPG